MKKSLKGIAILFACLFLLSTTVFAAKDDAVSPQSSAYIFGTYSNITVGSNGKLTISFGVSSPAPMTKLGACSIQVYENDGQSIRWVKTFLPTDPGCSGMMGSGTYHGGNVTYTGTPGYKYYAKVHLTARDSTGFDTITSTTPTRTAIK